MADLATLCLRFAPRLGGQVTPPTNAELERDITKAKDSKCDLSFETTNVDAQEAADRIFSSLSIKNDL